ncbi:MAG: type I-C CRISPR-associated protein Cas8c/Csd1, partial [Nitrososphaera sp.]|nr:type I-C CRISPR-associated protein Cas8c/Csd1 [Nitrososphaera sp.]
MTKDATERPKDAKDIFSVVNSQENAFVRWIVEGLESESRTWHDKTLWESWMNFYLGDKTVQSLCYVTGTSQLLINNHPRSIRREGDGAKLISSNDTTGFTFRGRFLTDQEACSVGLEVSHKSHNALAWLIDRQGFREGDLAIVAWAVSGQPVPQPTDDLPSSLYGNAPIEEDELADTAQEVGLHFKQRIAGYGKAIGNTNSIGVIALDSATTGRLAVTYYRDLTGSDYLQRIEHWHESCAWLHRYRFVEVQDKESGKTTWKPVSFIGAPAPTDIAEATYGSGWDEKLRKVKLDDKLRKATIERILPCIIDGQPLPRDLVESAIRRAANRTGLNRTGQEEWEWNKTLSIACALFRKYNAKENYDMALDPTRTTRDYLYGTLLALADSLEEWALKEAGEDRQTNAARLMQRFAERPYSTWRTIELALTPY